MDGAALFLQFSPFPSKPFQALQGRLQQGEARLVLAPAASSGLASGTTFALACPSLAHLRALLPPSGLGTQSFVTLAGSPLQCVVLGGQVQGQRLDAFQMQVLLASTTPPLPGVLAQLKAPRVLPLLRGRLARLVGLLHARGRSPSPKANTGN